MQDLLKALKHIEYLKSALPEFSDRINTMAEKELQLCTVAISSITAEVYASIEEPEEVAS